MYVPKRKSRKNSQNFLNFWYNSETVCPPPIRNTQERVVPEYGDGRGQRDVRLRGREQGREGRGQVHLARRRADAAETSSGESCIENNRKQKNVGVEGNFGDI